MTHRRDINASHARLTPDAVSEFLTILTSAENPLSGILTEVLNAAMLLERQHHLRADRHERTDERNGYANGYAGSGLCDRFCSKISVLAGLPMMPLAVLLLVLLRESCLVFCLLMMSVVGSCCISRCIGRSTV